MSGLKDRLRRLTGLGGGEDGQPSTRLHSAEDYTEEPLEEEWSRLGAVLIRNASGSFIRRRRTYSREHRHGAYAISELFGCADALTSFHPDHGGGPVQADKLLFFDTETTGLGLGAGNVPFMIGLGFWEEEEFAVEQLFIRNPAEELAMLAYLKPLMNRYPYLVSYNGRSFDWPLLLNRFVMNRMREGVPEPLHMDFLYPSRSLWKNTLPSCRLGKVEETQLGFVRQDDVPGSMAPTLYFLYLAERKPGSIAPVFLHNELDIVSLAGLAVLFARALEGQADMTGRQPEELYRLGLWLFKMGKHELSGPVMDRLFHWMLEEDYPGSGHLLFLPAAAHFKQQGNWERAVRLWERAIALSKEADAASGPPLAPYIELAMYQEHQLKDYAEALLLAEEALQWAEKRHSALRAAVRRSVGPRGRRLTPEQLLDPLAEYRSRSKELGGEQIAELEKRISRLRSKLLKAEAATRLQNTGRKTSGPTASHPPAHGRPGRSKRSSSAPAPDSLTLF